ncbi:MAG TPA: hypothetical protein VF765_13225 [Polyangiaceae bacterium]
MLLLPLLALAAACTPNLAATARAPELDRPGETKCGVKKSQSEPLVVEWPSAARAKLEALSRTGVVAVRYQGCEMEVLASCNAPGKYGYTAITPKHDHVAIKNEDDLYAAIPLGAARLEGKLESSGELDVDMAIVGRYASDRAVVRSDELQGPDCSKATHVVSALEVGAFDFYAGAGASVAGSAGGLGVGGGAGAKTSKEMLNSDGRMNGCDGASTSDGKPPEGCGAILRLEVVPLGEAKHDAPAAASKDQAAPAAGVGGELELTVPDKEYAFDVSVEAGGKTFTCAEPATYYKPCHLQGLPEGKAHVKVGGTSSFERDVPVSADGRTSVQLMHRGKSYEIAMGAALAVSAGLVVFGFENGGLSDGTNPDGTSANPNFVLNLTLVTIGGTFALLALPGMLGGIFSAHDGMLIESPGKDKEMAGRPKLQWGGLSAPTTWHF